jgi:hypothetical protein
MKSDTPPNNDISSISNAQHSLSALFFAIEKERLSAHGYH